MNKPTYHGWIDTLPDVKINAKTLLREYNQHIEPLMEDVVNQGNAVYIVNNGRHHTFVNAGNEPRLHLTFMDFGATNQNTY